MPQLLVSANCCRHAFEAGQQSKQAEIDELQKRINEAVNCLEKNKPSLEILKGEQTK